MIALIGIGIVLILTASPVVAAHHHWSPFVLLKRHLLIVGPGLIIFFLSSFFNKNQVILSSILVGILSWGALICVLLFGTEIKGAKRWLSIAGFSLQPSEFWKISTIILVAWIQKNKNENLLGLHPNLWTFALVMMTIFPLVLQPDFGMLFLILVIIFFQYFVSGISWLWIGAIISLGITGFLGAYTCFPHVYVRINGFLSGATLDRFGEQYQVLQAFSAFISGGLFGKGPGAGIILNTLPDSHADFIFAVAAEELGIIACCIIIAFYVLIVYRALFHASKETDSFYALVILGISLQFALQVFLNIGSVLRLIPTKGITLPFLSYGGSSFLSLCWSMGMLLSLTRRYRSLW